MKNKTTFPSWILCVNVQKELWIRVTLYFSNFAGLTKGKIMKPVSISISTTRNTTRGFILASMVIFGIAGTFYAQNSIATDGSMPSQSGQSGATAGQSSSGHVRAETFSAQKT
jgi:hypothetical protein